MGKQPVQPELERELSGLEAEWAVGNGIGDRLEQAERAEFQCGADGVAGDTGRPAEPHWVLDFAGGLMVAFVLTFLLKPFIMCGLRAEKNIDFRPLA
jgi:hypothetical protein